MNYTENLKIEYCGVECGCISLKFKKGNKNFEIICDELLNDPIPQLVNFFVNVKNGKDCVENFDEMYPNEKIFCLSAHNFDNKIFLEVKIYKHNIIFNEIYYKNDLIAMLKKIFTDLLNDKYFPYSFPCFWYLLEDIDDKFQDSVEEELEKLYPEWNYGDIINYAVAEGKFIVSQENKIYIENYKKMLTEYIIPKKWFERE